MSFQPPDACTLPTAEQPLRQAEFAALFRSALRGQDRLSRNHLRLTLTGGDELADTVRDLAGREQECCSFFEFTVRPRADLVVLDIEVPAGQASVLDGLSALAATATSEE